MSWGFKFLTALLSVILVVLVSGCSGEKENSITAFCGSASKPPMEEAARSFEELSGIKVYLNFGGSGTMLSQLKIARRGDLYIPGSPDFMAKAERGDVVYADSSTILTYLVPAILVQKGNPKNIKSLDDLLKPGNRVAIGDPMSVCVGLYAYEILEGEGLLDDVRKARTFVTYTESCEKTASLIVLKAVDAVMGWDVFANWNPDTTDVVYLEPEQIPRIAYVPGAVCTFTKNRAKAQEFLDYLASPAGQAIFARWGYVTTEQEARKYAPGAEIGGEYRIPDDYVPLVR